MSIREHDIYTGFKWIRVKKSTVQLSVMEMKRKSIKVIKHVEVIIHEQSREPVINNRVPVD